ncbi:hypothetical protein HY468_05350, partial [Candidatus Roizmanbacteria bacterium]|nr:hypothetical protein [Candidatus Roizmanbacteria bacterium]
MFRCLLGVFIIVLVFNWFVSLPVVAETTPLTTYYVDCVGDDTQAGTTAQTAWKTISRASTALLQPGDSLLFKRECVFTEPLTAAWSGTSDQLIIIGSYGTGEKPLISLNAQGTVKSAIGVTVTGSYLTIQNIS